MRLAGIVLVTGQLVSAASLMYVGTYTQKGSQGIYVWRFDSRKGEATALGLAAETPSPSWLTLHPRLNVMYAANELSNYQGLSSGAVSAWAIDRGTGKLQRLSIVPSRGGGPCHLTLDHSGNFLYVANYGGGSVARFPVKLDGQIGDAAEFVQHAKETRAPHAHSVTFAPDGKTLLVADLGLDKIMMYHPDLTAASPAFASVPEGSGPRHLAFTPSGKFFYVINELKSTVTGFRWDGRDAKEIGTVSSLPAGFVGEDSSAEIAVSPSGRFVYASNRGADTIACFRIGRDGALTAAGQTPSGGKNPRNFAFDPTGKWMLVANQDSNNIVIYKVNRRSGELTATGRTIQANMPVCVRFLAR
ncbi:MAG: lactonase family protein [Acidobacteriota bacterium]|nr:lactonase family protein [Acidobacteriota bacterium]